MPPFPPAYPRKSPTSPPEAAGEGEGATPPMLEAPRANSGSQYQTSPGEGRGTGEGRGPGEGPGPGEGRGGPGEGRAGQFTSPGAEGEPGTPPQYPYHGTPPGQYPGLQYSPRDAREEAPPAEPQDFSCERREPEQAMYPATREASSYDIIRNMTEKYGGLPAADAREVAQGFESRRSNLETVLSKMNRAAESEGLPEMGREQGALEMDAPPERLPPTESLSITPVTPPPPPQPPQQKPIKLRIAGGEVVANTVLDGEMEPIKVKIELPKPKVGPEKVKPVVKEEVVEEAKCFLDVSALTDLHLTIQTDEVLKERVSDIVGEDVLAIFADAVTEAETSGEMQVSNKNVVFLYYAVKNSTHLDLESVKKAELEPLSNLALSTPLLARLLAFVGSDPSLREQVQGELGAEQLTWLEGVVAASKARGEDFLQDPGLAPRAVPLYHAARNSVLAAAFERLAGLHRKTEAILSRTGTSEDAAYNTALARLQELVAAPWSQQVIAAEAMAFHFTFLATVYTFWRKVISSRACKPDRKTRKTKLKLDPSTFAFDTPKRSSRRRDEVITYDEDVLQNCDLKTGLQEVKLEPMD